MVSATVVADDLAAGRHRRSGEASNAEVLSSERVALRDPVLWIVAVAVLVSSATLAITHLVRFAPGSWDLGIFTEAERSYAHLHAPIVDIKGPGFDLLGDHFHPILIVLAPFFRMFPTPVTLLVAQALLTAVSVIPVYQAAHELLGRNQARLIAVAYGFSWGLAAMNGYDFHEVCFAVPLLAASLSALVRSRYRAAAWWAAPLVFVKEDLGLTVAAIGLALVLLYRRRQSGMSLAYWGIAWTIIAVYVIIPLTNPQHTYPYWKNSGHVLGLFTDGTSTKFTTLLLVLLPTAFAALWSPLALIALPELVLRFVSGQSVFWGTTDHYSATLMPIAFVAAVDGVSRARQRGSVGCGGGVASDLVSRYAAIVMVAVTASMLPHWPLSQVWHSSSYRVDPHARAAEAALHVVPSNTTVEASLNELAPLAARDTVYWWGSIAPAWILYDSTSPEWSETPTFIATRHPGATYRVAFDRDGVWVFQRTS
jgi:uncharacterized membrane protein